jgi:hypothetical protein
MQWSSQAVKPHEPTAFHEDHKGHQVHKELLNGFVIFVTFVNFVMSRRPVL